MTETVAGKSTKKILYVDMDNTLVDFQSGIDKLSEAEQHEFEGKLDNVPGIFSLMDPMEGAIEAYRQLSDVFDTYILSTAPWDNPLAWTEKLLWVKMHLGWGEDSPAYKRLILSHHKNLNAGDYIIDDRTARGVDLMPQGMHIHFGQPGFETWEKVVTHLLPLAK
ncbi:5' nucleotidase, NT5C type [Gordonia sp. NPDC003424]